MTNFLDHLRLRPISRLLLVVEVFGYFPSYLPLQRIGASSFSLLFLFSDLNLNLSLVTFYLWKKNRPILLNFVAGNLSSFFDLFFLVRP